MPDSQSHTNDQISLPDGRSLGYAGYGDPAGKPVLYFPGAPGSRLLHPPAGPTTARGVRLIVVERPGFGRSDYQPDRTLLDWPADVVALAAALGIDRFAVVGISAGGPYALACGRLIPHQLTGVALISPVGPADVPDSTAEMPRVRRAGAAVARRAPWLLRPLLWLTSNPHRNPERFFARMKSQNAPVDLEILTRPEVKAMLMRSYLEATRNGLRGFAREAVILANPWGFRPQDVTVPVVLWHGEADANVSLSAVRYLAQTLPHCRATFLPDEGHWLLLEHWEEVLASLNLPPRSQGGTEEEETNTETVTS
jgi:pimeloyl-ACP methyl ester carboxylesterase